MKKNILLVLALFVIMVSCKKKFDDLPIVVTPPVLPPVITTQKIKDLTTTFKFGAAVKTANLKSESAYDNTFKGEYNQLSAEFEMKMNFIWNSETSYNFTNVDYLVNYAQQNNMTVHGHTLLWYQSFPDWFKNANYDSVAFESKVKVYIETVVGRYKGKIKSWDVANEIFNDDGTMRIESQIQGKFKDPIGFVGRCFKYAAIADPDAKLFYNDYNVVLAAGKRTAMKNMAIRFKNAGIPIHGLGEQFHYRISTSQTQINSGFADLVSSGLLIHLSEIDCKVNTTNSPTYVVNSTDLQKQSDFFKNIVKLYNAIPGNQKFAMTTWGITDKNTWLRDSGNGNKEYPLLFDENYGKKPAYVGFLDGLK
ncbi:1,4-beta-xylanase [Pedobacter psychrophilus]|uniref:Beta-xylanase n=1 Tax=Pedobacter psychrophilus TaxID=1826909 RepID=A0A179DH95_9SPHI|nr:endo-1,4-beta-xylanase [Pedobacter psychrophilus]OAQ40284.1 1,4-beta-xylanase [Pedobacter psychrophilus]